MTDVRRVVGREELRELLLAQVENPTGFHFKELPQTVGHSFYQGLDETRRDEWYMPDADSVMLVPPVVGQESNGTRTGYYLAYTLRPGVHDVFVVHS